jgi:hypothetical protein
MIKFEYTDSNNYPPEGKTFVKIDSNIFFYENQIPLRLIQKNLKGKVIWSTDLHPEWFSEYPMNTYTTIEIIDSIGNTLLNWKWDPFIHGDYCHQSFELWALNNRGSNGIAIGTHDGMTGEWVGPVNKGLLRATLVEPSNYQFNELIKFYSNKSWVTCYQSLVTQNGGDVTFYEGGEGFTNSLSKNLIMNYLSDDEIVSTVVSSISINDLITQSSKFDKVEWLHLDVEGLDGELIYSISDDLLPKLLLFESLHMNIEYYTKLCDYLVSKGYHINKSGFNTICLK